MEDTETTMSDRERDFSNGNEKGLLPLILLELNSIVFIPAAEP